MGCVVSKQRKSKRCEEEYSPPPMRSSYSMNRPHSPISKGDPYHSVALASSTLGSIKLKPPSILNGNDSKCIDNDDKWRNHYNGICEKENIDIDMNEAKAWSKMIDKKISMVVAKKCCPKTPIMTPPGEPESIDVDELMEGLEGITPPRFDKLTSFSFHVGSDHLHVVDTPKGMPQEEALVSLNERQFDAQEKEHNVPNYILDYEAIFLHRKSFEELAPTSPFVLKRGGCDEQNGNDHVNGFAEMVDDGVVLHTNGFPMDGIVAENEDKLSSKKKRVILYFTSLRGVRKTYEDCCYVKLVVKGYRVRVDERDVSMHSGFKQELNERLGEGFKGGLPKVFVGDKYIGGVDEMRQLHEDGQLGKVLKDCEYWEDDSGNIFYGCEGCGDIRFVPCQTCSGSCKVYYECEDDEELYLVDEYGFQKCPDCNENGIVRCPFCCF